MSLSNIMKQDLSYNEKAKSDFHRKAKKALKNLAVKLNFQPSDFTIRSNKAGIASSGEVTLHHEKIYIQVSQSLMGYNNSVLFRTCEGQKDYRGGQNHYTSADSLEGNIDAFTLKIKNLIN